MGCWAGTWGYSGTFFHADLLGIGGVDRCLGLANIGGDNNQEVSRKSEEARFSSFSEDVDFVKRQLDSLRSK